MTAYNYDKQQWVTGEEARLLLIEQIEESLAIYTGPKAAEFARFNGLRSSVIPGIIRALECRLEALN